MFVFVVLDLEQGFFGFFELFGGCGGESKVPVEVIIVDEVWSDGFQVYEHIIKLLENEEALGHALTSWDGIALRW